MLEYNEFYLTLIRHGQSIVNMNPEAVGQTSDVPLSELGRSQALALHERFKREESKFDIVYSSTYTRALDTALLATGADPRYIITTDELREYSAGNWIGGKRSELFTPTVLGRMNVLNHSFLPPNGESLHQVERRASQWLEETILYNEQIMSFASFRKQNKIAPLEIGCFSHGMTIKCLLHYIMGFDKSFTWKVTIENTAISKLYFGKEGWRLISINDHGHLSTVKG
jgi:broad specificity phosphatase PhoE